MKVIILALARRFALFIGFDLKSWSKYIELLQRDAIVFAAQKKENLPFLEVASQFTHKMQRQDRTKVLRYLQQNSSAFATFSTSLTIGEFQIFILHVTTFKLNCFKLPIKKRSKTAKSKESNLRLPNAEEEENGQHHLLVLLGKLLLRYFKFLRN